MTRFELFIYIIVLSVVLFLVIGMFSIQNTSSEKRIEAAEIICNPYRVLEISVVESNFIGTSGKIRVVCATDVPAIGKIVVVNY